MKQDPAPPTAGANKEAGALGKPRGHVSINPEGCKGCRFCVAFCPTGVLQISSEFNAKGYHYPEVVHPDKCNGCDLCGMYCPDFAICGARLPLREVASKE